MFQFPGDAHRRTEGLLRPRRPARQPAGRGPRRLPVPGDEERRALAARLGYSETVFVDDPERGLVDIWTPSLRLPFAGHPCVGTAWLLDVPELVTGAGVVAARQDGEFTWIEARPEWAPPRALRAYDDPDVVDKLQVPRRGSGSTPGRGARRRRAASAPAPSPAGATAWTRTRPPAPPPCSSPPSSAAPSTSARAEAPSS
ncbi:PhzF family phenazine biosynthesis protein [Actinomadura keratinilytica]